ncbi:MULTISPECIES: LLM class flavin-dependent oxidoreductase [Cryobacterium]|uniref:LLM class flavin-dependent oxidoreductase n=1 Tax=Cryobacterium breve TaxID=1259258 RepID=A0ABY2IW21_9MICO|nr:MULTISPECIES: LLM class flavin-dependent oxidoreductase [Cryobacterium]TFC94436.1 LLM class flavin-dependent oxidoreductase [Cryobacterium sp. TmT3-12]TFC95040.1 LLM class flavin-dependent oxidoreductase [Cryobacterium breve]
MVASPTEIADEDAMSLKLSVMAVQQPNAIKSLVPVADLARGKGAHALWMGQSFGIDAHASFAYLAGAGYSIRVGMGVALTPLRHPYDAALQVRSLLSLGLSHVTVAFGPGAPEFSRAILGQPLARPVAHTEQYMSVVKQLLQTGGVQAPSELFNIQGSMQIVPAPEIEVGGGVLRPAMAAAVGRSGDVAVTWLAPPSYIADRLIPAMIENRPGGRTRPRVVAIVPVAVARPGRTARVLARAAVERHLSGSHYVSMLKQAGLEMHEKDAMRNIAEVLEHDVFVYGTPAKIISALARYEDAGVDEIVLSTVGVGNAIGLEDAVQDLRLILAANQ